MPEFQNIRGKMLTRISVNAAIVRSRRPNSFNLPGPVEAIEPISNRSCDSLSNEPVRPAGDAQLRVCRRASSPEIWSWRARVILYDAKIISATIAMTAGTGPQIETRRNCIASGSAA